MGLLLLGSYWVVAEGRSKTSRTKAVFGFADKRGSTLFLLDRPLNG